MTTLTKLGLVTILAAGVAVEARAISLTSANATFTGFNDGALSLSEVETITGATDLTLVYRQNVGGSEEGSFIPSYTTTFSNSPSEPSDATITWDGAPDPFISGSPIYVYTKDGTPRSWYIWDITGWDGKETISITGLYPQQGAISQVTIYAGPASVPDGGSTFGLLGLAFILVGTVRRITSV